MARKVSDEYLHALSDFRYELRKFLRASEEQPHIFGALACRVYLAEALEGRQGRRDGRQVVAGVGVQQRAGGVVEARRRERPDAHVADRESLRRAVLLEFRQVGLRDGVAGVDRLDNGCPQGAIRGQLRGGSDPGQRLQRGVGLEPTSSRPSQAAPCS